MPEETPEEAAADPRHPRLRMRGPQASLPAVGEDPPKLPYSSGAGDPGSRPRWAALLVLAAFVLLVAGIVTALALTGGDGDATATRSSRIPSVADSPTTTTGSDRTDAATTTEKTSTDENASTKKASTEKASTKAGAQETTTTKAAPKKTTTTTEAASTTTQPPQPTVPVNELPPHEAVYQDGKLVLQGTLPDPKIAEQFRQKAAEVIGDDNVIVRYQFDDRVPVPTDGHVRVAEQFIFPKNSAEVNPDYLSIFNLGVAVLKLNPQATMRIRGYTDDSGPEDFNQRLSQARAQAAANYLIANGIDPKRLTVVGFGEADPVAPNDTEENRAQNRRIQVDLYNLLGA